MTPILQWDGLFLVVLYSDPSHAVLISMTPDFPAFYSLDFFFISALITDVEHGVALHHIAGSWQPGDESRSIFILKCEINLPRAVYDIS